MSDIFAETYTKGILELAPQDQFTGRLFGAEVLSLLPWGNTSLQIIFK